METALHEDELYAELVNVVRTLGHTHADLPPHQDLYAELGLRPVDGLSLLLALEDKFNVEIDDVAFTRARTLAEIAELLRSSRGDDAR